MAFGEASSVQAKTGFGFKFYYDAMGGNDPAMVEIWTPIEGMKSGALPSPDKPEIDVTTTTDDVKAFIPGIGTINDLSIEFNFYPENEVHQDLVENVLYNAHPRPWKIEGAGMVFTFMGYLKSANVSFGVDAALTMPLTLKVTTKPEVTWSVVDRNAPIIGSVTASEDKTYSIGEEIVLTALFSEVVEVSGTPAISLVVGSANKSATYKSGSGTSSLTFGYTVQQGDSDTDGIECASRIMLHGGSIKDAGGNNAILTFTPPVLTGVKVSGVTPPMITTVEASAAKTYIVGEDITVTATFDKAVVVTGDPYIALTVGDAAKEATYRSGSGSQNIVFAYTVESGDYDDDGVVCGSAIELNGGAIKSLKDVDASLTFAVPPMTGVMVSGNPAPSVAEVTVSEDKTYATGDKISFTVRFSEAVTVVGNPSVDLTVGSDAKFATYETGSGTDTLVFGYTVEAGDVDADGIDCNSEINLNGGSIKSALGIDAVLTMTPPVLTGVLVSGT